MTNEERARIARENGAKSKGPTTEAGRRRSSRNALKTGEHAEMFKHFVPPHEATLYHEDRQRYQALVEELVANYLPKNQAAFAVIRDMAIARWQIERMHRCVTMLWNVALIEANKKPETIAHDLREIQTMTDALAELLSGNGLLSKTNREISRLQQGLARSERRLKFIHANFPTVNLAPEIRTQPEDDTDIENTDLNQSEPEESDKPPLPIYTTEDAPEVIAAYRREFPGRPIVIMPADSVANGVDEPYDMPRAPRKVG